MGTQSDVVLDLRSDVGILQRIAERVGPDELARASEAARRFLPESQVTRLDRALSQVSFPESGGLVPAPDVPPKPVVSPVRPDRPSRPPVSGRPSFSSSGSRSEGPSRVPSTLEERMASPEAQAALALVEAERLAESSLSQEDVRTLAVFNAITTGTTRPFAGTQEAHRGFIDFSKLPAGMSVGSFTQTYVSEVDRVLRDAGLSPNASYAPPDSGGGAGTSGNGNDVDPWVDWTDDDILNNPDVDTGGGGGGGGGSITIGQALAGVNWKAVGIGALVLIGALYWIRR